MSDDQIQANADLTDELAVLKLRARTMGITFSNNIGLEALKLKINAKMEGEPEPKEATTVEANPLVGDTEPPVRPLSLREHLIRENMKLIRCRITNMNPNKRDLKGEIYTVANEYLGDVKKYVPFGDESADGYHLPKILYDDLLSRKFLNVRTTTGKDGQIKVEQSWVREFAIEVLPPLTKDELSKLATAQIAGGVFNPEE